MSSILKKEIYINIYIQYYISCRWLYMCQFIPCINPHIFSGGMLFFGGKGIVTNQPCNSGSILFSPVFPTTRKPEPLPFSTWIGRFLRSLQRGFFDSCCSPIVSHRIHGTDIFTYIYHKNQPNVGKYTSPMDPMGFSPEKKSTTGLFHHGWANFRRTIFLRNSFPTDGPLFSGDCPPKGPINPLATRSTQTLREKIIIPTCKPGKLNIGGLGLWGWRIHKPSNLTVGPKNMVSFGNVHEFPLLVISASVKVDVPIIAMIITYNLEFVDITSLKGTWKWTRGPWKISLVSKCYVKLPCLEKRVVPASKSFIIVVVVVIIIIIIIPMVPQRLILCMRRCLAFNQPVKVSTNHPSCKSA